MAIDPRALRESASFPESVIAEIQRAAREGLYDIRGFGAKRRLPTFDDLVFLGASVSRYPLEGYRERCATNVTIGARFAEQPIELAIPITIAGMSFGALGVACQGGARPRRHRDGHQHDHRRWRHDRRGARRVQDPGLPGAAVALRPQPRRPAPRRCDRGRGRPGRQARRRRHAARAQDHRAGRGDAHAAAGHRPAQRLPPSRLDRPGRSHDQDRRAARDHRLAKADLRQDRRDAHQLRRGALRQGRGRCDRARRHAGRHRRHPGRVHRACRHPDPAGGAPGGRGAAGARHAPQGAADRVRRHQERRRRRQGHGDGRRCGLDRHRGADRAELQRAAVRGGLRRARHQARLLPPLPYRTLPGRHHHPGSRAGEAPRRRAGGAPGAQLSLDHGAGGADAGARLRQVASAQPGARGPRRAHGRGGGDGAACRSPAPTGFRARRPTDPAQGGRTDGDGSRGGREEGWHQVFPDQLRRPVRRAAREAGPGRGDRRHAEGGRRLCRLRHLARHDAGRSGHVRDPRPEQPDPAAVAARGRLARGRSVDGRQGGRERAAGGPEAPDRGRGRSRATA